MSLKSYSRVYYLMYTNGFLVTMGIGLPRAFLPLMAFDLDPSGTIVGLVMSAWFITRIFVELPSGIISYRFGCRNLIAAGILIAIIGSLVCYFSRSILLLASGMAIWGLGSALFFTSNTSLILSLFEPSRRAKAVGNFQTLEFIGQFIGSPLGALLSVFIGYNGVFAAISILMVPGLLVTLTSRDLRIADCEVRRGVELPTLRKTLSGLRNSSLLKVGYLNLSRFMIAQGLVLTFLPLYLETRLGFEVELIGVVIGMRAAGMVVGTVVSGRAIARVGSKRLIVASLLMMGTCYLVYSVIQTFEYAAFVTLFEGLGSGLLMVSLLVLMADLAPPSCRNSAVGAYRTFQDAGGFLGPIFFMFLYTSLGAHQAFWSASTLFFFNVIVTVSIGSRWQRHLGRRFREYDDENIQGKQIGTEVPSKT